MRSWIRLLLTAMGLAVGLPLHAQSLKEHWLFSPDVKAAVVDFAFSPDSSTLVAVLTRADEKTNKVTTEIARWDVPTGKALRPFLHDGGRRGLLAFRQDGRMLLTADDDALTIRDAASGKEKVRIPQEADPPDVAAFSPKGLTVFGVAFRFQREQQLRAWDVIKRTETFAVKRPLRQGTAAFSPDGQILAWSYYQDVDIWDVVRGKEIRVLADHRGLVNCLDFAQDARTLAVGAIRRDDQGKEHTQVKLWDATTGKEQATFEDLVESLCSVAISPDARLLGVLGSKRARDPATLRLFDVALGRERAVLPLPLQDIMCLESVRFSPDGRRLAVVRSEGIRVWNVVPAEGR